ncbi:MAG: ThuA domain-containing protein [Huintestinicola sp.]|uniref:ThuA domain-containing protein n=1 Tax=Huintestinicola sp. TaxID=2981661 RepID=UPI003F0D2F10
MINVLIWNEYIHEKEQPEVAAIYPEGIHKAIGNFLADDDSISVRYATLDMPKNGITREILEDTDVLIWWGHQAHDRVSDETVSLVTERINGGMGFIPLHSAHHSRIFKALCGTSCNLKWRHGDRERIWCISPSHLIAMGIPEHFELPHEEMYGEPFDIPTPDEVVFMGWFSGGEVFRSGVTFKRGAGRIFYFQPGHEEYPIYHDENVLKIIRNAVKWAAPLQRESRNIPCTNPEPLEKGL